MLGGLLTAGDKWRRQAQTQPESRPPGAVPTACRGVCPASETSIPRVPRPPLTLLGPQAAAGPGSGEDTPTRSIPGRRRGRERSGEVTGRGAGSAEDTGGALATRSRCRRSGDRWRRRWPPPELDRSFSALLAGALTSYWSLAQGGITSGLCTSGLSGFKGRVCVDSVLAPRR